MMRLLVATLVAVLALTGAVKPVVACGTVEGYSQMYFATEDPTMRVAALRGLLCVTPLPSRFRDKDAPLFLSLVLRDALLHPFVVVRMHGLMVLKHYLKHDKEGVLDTLITGFDNLFPVDALSRRKGPVLHLCRRSLRLPLDREREPRPECSLCDRDEKALSELKAGQGSKWDSYKLASGFFVSYSSSGWVSRPGPGGEEYVMKPGRIVLEDLDDNTVSVSEDLDWLQDCATNNVRCARKDQFDRFWACCTQSHRSSLGGGFDAPSKPFFAAFDVRSGRNGKGNCVFEMGLGPKLRLSRQTSKSGWGVPTIPESISLFRLATVSASPHGLGGMRRGRGRAPACREPMWTVVGPTVRYYDRALHRRKVELLKEGKAADFNERASEAKKAARESVAASPDELRMCFDKAPPGRRNPRSVRLKLLVDESGEFLVEGHGQDGAGQASPEAKCVAGVLANLHVDLARPLPAGLTVSFEVYAFDVRLESIEVEDGPLDADRILNALDPVVEQLRTEVPRMLPKPGKDLNLAKKFLDSLSFVMVIDKTGKVSEVVPTRFITTDFFAQKLLKLVENLLTDVELAPTSGETTARVKLLLRCF